MKSSVAGPVVRWGVLGTGMIATTRTIPAMQTASRARVVSIASRRAETAQQAAQALGIPRAAGSYEQLLQDPDVDAVYVPLPNHLHVEWSVRALEAGKHVLCEKPLALSSTEVRQLLAARDRTGRHIEEAFVFRNHPQWTYLQQQIRAGAVGGVRGIHGTLAKQFLDPDDIRNDPARGGGALYDLGAYVIAACGTLLQRRPQRVLAALDRDPVYGTDRLSTALLDYGDAHATFTVATQAGTAAWGTHQSLTVLGTDGWLACDFPYAHARPTACHVHHGNSTTVGSFPSSTVRFDAVDSYALQIERFSSHLLGEQVPVWPIEDALQTLSIIEGLFASARSGGWETLR